MSQCRIACGTRCTLGLQLSQHIASNMSFYFVVVSNFSFFCVNCGDDYSFWLVTRQHSSPAAASERNRTKNEKTKYRQIKCFVLWRSHTRSVEVQPYGHIHFVAAVGERLSFASFTLATALLLLSIYFYSVNLWIGCVLMCRCAMCVCVCDVCMPLLTLSTSS